MCTSKTALISLTVISLVCIIVLSHYQLIASSQRGTRTNRRVPWVQTDPLKGLIRTICTSIVTLLEGMIIALRGAFGFPLPATSVNDARQKPAPWTKSRRSHFQFRYVVNSFETCSRRLLTSSSVFLLNYVHSAVSNFARRARVRASWARGSNYPDDRVKTVFIVGLPSGHRRRATQTAVEAEARQFGDIVQVDVVDSYRCTHVVSYNYHMRGIHGSPKI